MKPAQAGKRRWLSALCLVFAAFCLSGCVYLRLLSLKRQLGEFDRNFRLQTADGLRLVCFNPVLLTADLRWLGVTPERTEKSGRDERWWVHWVKQTSTKEAGPEAAAHDIELEIDFTENKFSGFFVAERYFAFIPKTFFIGLLRGLGGASVDQDKRAVTANIALGPNSSAKRPTVSSLLALLGTPTEQKSPNPGTTQLRYRYLPPSPGTNNGDFDLLFTFDTSTGLLLRLEGHSPVGRMLLNFPAPAAPSEPELSSAAAK
jgi:hypothetical protein